MCTVCEPPTTRSNMHNTLEIAASAQPPAQVQYNEHIGPLTCDIKSTLGVAGSFSAANKSSVEPAGRDIPPINPRIKNMMALRRMDTHDAVDTDTLLLFSFNQDGTVVRNPKLKMTVLSTWPYPEKSFTGTLAGVMPP